MRRSSHDHLKPEILALFAEGKSPAEVAKNYPGIPRPTVYDWHKKWLQENTDSIPTDSDNLVNTGSQVAGGHPKLSVISSPEDGIGWALLQCKDIIKSEKKRDPRAAIAALNTYLRALEVGEKIYGAEMDEEAREALKLCSDEELEAIHAGRVPPNPSEHYWTAMGRNQKRWWR
jgi:hypothetical protein